MHSFADRASALDLARDAAARMAAVEPAITRVLLFGSFARDDYTRRSDLDLLVVLSASDCERRARVERLIDALPVYPIDVFPYTKTELDDALRTGDRFVLRALREGIEVFGRAADLSALP